MRQDELVEIIRKLAEELRVETVPTVREMQEELNKCGITAYLQPIHNAYKTLGYKTNRKNGHRFVFKHNPAKGE